MVKCDHIGIALNGSRRNSQCSRCKTSVIHNNKMSDRSKNERQPNYRRRQKNRCRCRHSSDISLSYDEHTGSAEANQNDDVRYKVHSKTLGDGTSLSLTTNAFIASDEARHSKLLSPAVRPSAKASKALSCMAPSRIIHLASRHYRYDTFLAALHLMTFFVALLCFATALLIGWQSRQGLRSVGDFQAGERSFLNDQERQPSVFAALFKTLDDARRSIPLISASASSASSSVAQQSHELATQSKQEASGQLLQSAWRGLNHREPAAHTDDSNNLLGSRPNSLQENIFYWHTEHDRIDLESESPNSQSGSDAAVIKGPGWPRLMHRHTGPQTELAPNLVGHSSRLHSEREQVTVAEKAEAEATLRIAEEMQRKGRYERAHRLFRHAFSLNRHWPHLLVAFGQFIEQHQHNPLLAEHLYARAILLEPHNEQALVNRLRLLPLVQQLDAQMYHRLQLKRDRLIAVPDTHAGLRRAKRDNFYRHVYHSAAIEGNTLNVRQIRFVLQTGLAVGGKSVIEHNELLGLNAALRYINLTLLARSGPVELVDILEIHRRVLGYVDPVGAGRLRESQVFVGDYAPPPSSELQRLLDEMLMWLNGPDAERLSPVELAALAHYKLVVIHPFFDGNGRTARLLMNWLLMRAGFPAIILPVQQQLEYYECLRTANAGDVRPFVRFVARHTERTLDEFLDAVGHGAGAALPAAPVVPVVPLVPIRSHATTALSGQSYADAPHSSEVHDTPNSPDTLRIHDNPDNPDTFDTPDALHTSDASGTPAFSDSSSPSSTDLFHHQLSNEQVPYSGHSAHRPMPAIPDDDTDHVDSDVSLGDDIDLNIGSKQNQNTESLYDRTSVDLMEYSEVDSMSTKTPPVTSPPK